MVTQISNNIFMLEGGNNGAIVQLTGARDTSFGGTGWNQSDIFEHVRWGAGDNQPNVNA